MQQHRRGGVSGLQRPPAPCTRKQPLEDCQHRTRRSRSGPDLARSPRLGPKTQIRPAHTRAPPADQCPAAPPCQHLSNAPASPCPASGPDRARRGPRSDPRRCSKHRHRAHAPGPRLRDNHHREQLRQGARGLHHDAAARHQPEHPPPPPAAAMSQTGPRRRPSTARASPCSFLRGGGEGG
jgi:hypothetical protein